MDARVAADLARYGALLLEANRSVNLTAARSPEALIPHLLDALTLVPYVTGAAVTGAAIDVGAGGGLPGIPLALATGRSVTLVEAVGKKAAFLEEAVAALGIEGEVHAGRAELLGHDPRLRARFAAATARAVGPASTVAELTVPFLVRGGVALLQRGRLEPDERTAVADAAIMLGAEVVAEHSVDGERRVLVLEKRAETPARFPRRTGVPAKRPLCAGRG